VSPLMQQQERTNEDAFTAWAAVYDRQQNPLLALEDRILAHILPDAKGRDVVDAGCGTGRWLTYFAGADVASLCGFDSSDAMLEIAACRELPAVHLLRAALPSIPLECDSADLVIASFVLSYVTDLEKCASEFARVIRNGGDLFISDMHPDTVAALGWTRSFSTTGQTWHLDVQNRAIQDIVNIFESKGFRLVAALEPQFGALECEFLRLHGKEHVWQTAIGRPPIYLLHFRREPEVSSHPQKAAGSTLTLQQASCVLGPRDVMPVEVRVNGGNIAAMLSDAVLATSSNRSEDCHINLDGYLLFPGLVNAHDHLEFALFPRLGSPPYRNATEWAADIQASNRETIDLHQKVPKAVRLWWGGIRNLLCGVTTVCHHNPLHPDMRSTDFPVRIVQDYGWEHSIAFGADIPATLLSTGPAEPFFIHAGEGVDPSAAAELGALDAMGVLEDRTVLVHGLALDEAGAKLLNDRGAALVICPTSNNFLFHQTHKPEQCQSIHRLALGSDSPLTADGDLLDELRFAHHSCRLDTDQLFRMVTDQASRILRLRSGEGSLRVGSVADVFAVRHQRAGDPAKILASLSWRDVELVLLGGQVRLVSEELRTRLPLQLRQGLTPLQVEDKITWLRGPVLPMLEAAEAILGEGRVRVGGLRVSRVAGEQYAC
jgi:cytosine/adenosine deaminase-related metal-dependent hydrolase/ubiquinone/menaquinone biosynthesis C-methylase UbiE